MLNMQRKYKCKTFNDQQLQGCSFLYDLLSWRWASWSIYVWTLGPSQKSIALYRSSLASLLWILFIPLLCSPLFHHETHIGHPISTKEGNGNFMGLVSLGVIDDFWTNWDHNWLYVIGIKSNWQVSSSFLFGGLRWFRHWCWLISFRARRL